MSNIEQPAPEQSREELLAEIQEHRIRTAILLADTALFLVESDRRVDDFTRRFEESKAKSDEAIKVLKRAFAIPD